MTQAKTPTLLPDGTPALTILTRPNPSGRYLVRCNRCTHEWKSQNTGKHSLTCPRCASRGVADVTVTGQATRGKQCQQCMGLPWRRPRSGCACGQAHSEERLHLDEHGRSWSS